MKQSAIESFHIVGIEIRTTNENNQAMEDIPKLWKRFMAEQIAGLIPSKMNDTIYCVYTDYESDHAGPYTVILGCQVASFGNVPDGMRLVTIEGGTYQVVTKRGNVMKGLVVEGWHEIWHAPIQRSFKADFEVYDHRAANPEDAEVDIFVSIS